MDASILSPSIIFEHAGPVGKTVIVVLLAASVWCWVLIADGAFALFRLARALKKLQRGEVAKLIRPVIDEGEKALQMELPGDRPADARLRCIEAMNRASGDVLSTADRGLSNLAIIASVAPFVGLLGTVWGILTSFAGIAESGDTSLAVVAPGIAESLVATAIGLAAAIPAAVAHSRISASFGKLAQKLGHLIEAVSVQLTARKCGEASAKA